VSCTEEAQQRILDILGDYCDHAKLEVKTAKCVTISSIRDIENGIRRAIREPLVLCGREIPFLAHAESVRYLGVPISGTQRERAILGHGVLTQMPSMIDQIAKSPLFIPQKIQTVMVFVLPEIDSLLLNGDVSKRELKEFDAHLRGEIQKWIGGRGIPKALFHTPWERGGSSLPSLYER
jgi:hypothetical protein